MNNNKVTRGEILDKAFHDCMCEMYAKSQPEADWDNLIEEYRSGKIGRDERIYERHYLSQDEFKYILEKYKTAYNIKAHWRDDVEVVEDYLTKGGHKDKLVEREVEENGFVHPSYRSYEEVPPINVLIENYLKEKTTEDVTEMSKDITEIVLDTIKNCKDYYLFDREENGFDYEVSLGASPTCNPETVKKWWKENYDQDIEIEERNPLLFWYRDEGYTDEDMAEEYDSDDWKEIMDKEWKEMVEAKKKEEEERLEKFKEECQKQNNE